MDLCRTQDFYEQWTCKPCRDCTYLILCDGIYDNFIVVNYKRQTPGALVKPSRSRDWKIGRYKKILLGFLNSRTELMVAR